MKNLVSEGGQSVAVGLQDVGGHESPLSSYRFLASATTKAAAVRLYNTAGEVIAEETLTATTTAQRATADALWAGDWSEAYAGMEVVTADATIYALPSADGTPEVTAANGKALAAGMWFGAVPQHVRDAFEATAAGGATAANQASGLVLLGAVNETDPASDTASSGLNGRLQRIAQRLASLIALLPASIGQKAKAAALAVTLSSDEDLYAASTPGKLIVTTGVGDNTGAVLSAVPARLTFLDIGRNGASACFVKLYDKATAASAADTPVAVFMMQSSTARNPVLPVGGLNFAAGISVRCVTVITDADTTSVGTATVVLSYGLK